MNKIIISDKEIKFEKKDGLIDMIVEGSSKVIGVCQIKLIVKESTSLKINQKMKKQKKFHIILEVKPEVVLNVLDFKQGENFQMEYKYSLEKNSTLNLLKFYDAKQGRESDLIDLNGENAEISYHLKTISREDQVFDLQVHHNASTTKSNIIHHGVNMQDGSLSFNLTGIVYKDKVNCILNQNSRIVTLNEKKCNINPNLLIEENDVIANHSAFVGKFSEEELFYLQSRAISYQEALSLLIKGFLLENIHDEEIIKTINQYWR